MEGICINSGTDVIKLHFGSIADIDTLNPDTGKEKQESHNHVYGDNYKDTEEGQFATLIPSEFLNHTAFLLFPIMFAYAGSLSFHINRNQIEFPKSAKIAAAGYSNVKGSTNLYFIRRAGALYLIGDTIYLT